MLVVKHLTGPLAGQALKIDPKLDRLVFGRKADCQIVYPPEETIVAREHFALQRKPPGPTGHWTVDLFGEPFVAVNGIAADQGQGVASGTRFELGKRGGPSFEVVIDETAAEEALPKTSAQVHAPAARAAAAFSRRLAALALLAAAAAGGIAAFYYFRSSQLQIDAAVRDRLARAAFLVQSQNSGEATAFPVGKRLLATNGHVAESYDNLTPGQKLYVRSPGKNGRLYQVVGRKIHPGYKALDEFMGEDVLRRRSAQLNVPGYDVALLQVDQDLPDEAILEVASTEELNALTAGSVIGSAGYPMEGVIGAPAQSYGATPELHVGLVTGFTDFFFLPSEFSHAQLMHDDLPAAGGASGSPITGRSGRVVAIRSAGNSYHPGENEARVPSGVLVNYSQRADILRELLDGNADQHLAEAKEYWAKRLATFPTGEQVAIRYLEQKTQRLEGNANIKLSPTRAISGALSPETRAKKDGGGIQRQANHALDAAGGASYVIFAYSPEGAPIQLWVYRDGQLVGESADDSFLPTIRYNAKDDSKLDVWVVGPKDQDVPYKLDLLKINQPG